MIVVTKFIFNPFNENTYVVWDEKTKEGIVIDPGCSNTAEEKEISDFIKKMDLSLNTLINTHCHVDHILGNKFIKENFNLVYYASKEELPLLENSEMQASAFGIEMKKSPLPDKYITKHTTLKLGESSIIFLFTPGHTPGEYCIYIPNEKICFTGDVLFKGSIGRTDLWGGDYETLINSIKNQLFSLLDDVFVYPGHGENSTIGTEKRENPFLVDLNKS